MTFLNAPKTRGAVAATVAMAAGGVAMSSAPADAYVRSGCRQYSRYVHYINQGSTPRYRYTFAGSANDWTNTNTPVVMVEDNNDPWVGIRDVYEDNNYTGYAYTGCQSNGLFSKRSLATVNRRNVGGESDGLLKSVTGHEIGHVLGLAHDGTLNCNSTPLMYNYDERFYNCGVNTPKRDDENGLNDIYYYF